MHIARFRWVALQYGELLRLRYSSLRKLEEQLKSLPRGLNSSYERILSYSREPEDLKILLQWLAYSRSEVTMEELAEVAKIHFPDNDSELPACDPDRGYANPCEILNVGYGLVVEVQGTRAC